MSKDTVQDINRIIKLEKRLKEATELLTVQDKLIKEHSMQSCHVCDLVSNELNVCERCEQNYCETCSATYNQFTQIDYNCCIQCSQNR